jgi:hypothetical protein
MELLNCFCPKMFVSWYSLYRVGPLVRVALGCVCGGGTHPAPNIDPAAVVGLPGVTNHAGRYLPLDPIILVGIVSFVP